MFRSPRIAEHGASAPTDAVVVVCRHACGAWFNDGLTLELELALLAEHAPEVLLCPICAPGLSSRSGGTLSTADPRESGCIAACAVKHGTLSPTTALPSGSRRRLPRAQLRGWGGSSTTRPQRS